MIEKTVEDRLHDLESLVYDFPTLVSLRDTRVESELAALRAATDELVLRATRSERATMMLQNDVRDMRNYLTVLTRMVAGTNAKIDKLDKRVSELEIKLAAHDARFDAIEHKLVAHDARFDALDRKLDAILAKLDG